MTLDSLCAARAEALSALPLPFCAPLAQLYVQRVNDLAHFSKHLTDVGRAIQLVRLRPWCCDPHLLRQPLCMCECCLCVCVCVDQLVDPDDDGSSGDLFVSEQRQVLRLGEFTRTRSSARLLASRCTHTSVQLGMSAASSLPSSCSFNYTVRACVSWVVHNRLAHAVLLPPLLSVCAESVVEQLYLPSAGDYPLTSCTALR